jgi:hypothetical protein
LELHDHVFFMNESRVLQRAARWHVLRLGDGQDDGQVKAPGCPLARVERSIRRRRWRS